MSIIFCRSLTEAESNITSSAYISEPQGTAFIRQPYLDNLYSKLSTYTENRIGEITPP